MWTAANPGIPAGGVVGESKADILAQLDPRHVAPTVLVPAGALADRISTALAAGWDYPLILKPDAGQRGAGVRKVHDREAGEQYLAANPGPVVVQPFHPGPFEAGVFYYRLPGEAHGHLFSVTDKVFPVATATASRRWKPSSGRTRATDAGGGVPGAARGGPRRGTPGRGAVPAGDGGESLPGHPVPRR